MMQEQTEIQRPPARARLRLALDVTFETQDSAFDDADVSHLGEQLLQDLVRLAMNRGLVTGETPLEVESHEVKVMKLDGDAGQPNLRADQMLALFGDCQRAFPGSARDAVVVEFARRVQTYEREQCASLCVMRADEVRLMFGEISPAEMRTIQAILGHCGRTMLGRVASDVCEMKSASF